MWHRSTSAFLALMLLLLLGSAWPVHAQTQEYLRPYQRTGYKPGETPPTSADLRIYQGTQKTVAVQILNLTPYTIELKSTSITAQDELDMQNRERETNKSFMFAPVGVPKTIPPAGPNSHPYAMVFSWVDDPTWMTDNWAKWTVKQVDYCTLYDEVNNKCVGDTETARGPNWASRDVDLGLWMYRLEPPPTEVDSNYLPLLGKILLTVFKTGMLALEVENPMAWVEEFLALKELGTTIKEFDTNGSSEEQNQAFGEGNTQWDDGSQIYLASYVVPHPTSFCTTSGLDCMPSSMTEQTGDGVYSFWPAGNAGPCDPVCPKLAAEAELTVSVHVLRGQSTPQCPTDVPDYSIECGVGRVPLMMVTVMKTTEFLAGKVATVTMSNPITSQETSLDRMRLFMLKAGAGKIRAILLREGRPGLIALRSVIETLSPAQREVIRQMIGSMASDRNPTKEERDLVHWVGMALEKKLN